MWDRQCPVAQWPLSDAVPWQPLGSSAVAVTAGTLLALAMCLVRHPLASLQSPRPSLPFWASILTHQARLWKVAVQEHPVPAIQTWWGVIWPF